MAYFQNPKKIATKKIIIKSGNQLSLNTNYEEWKVLPKKATVAHLSNPVADSGNELLPKEVDTKDSKENIQNKHLKSDKSQKAYKFKIIFLFASKKEFSLEDAEIKRSFILRQLRHAKLLTPYPFERIVEVMDWLNKNADYKWTLETVGKHIDEDLEAITKKEPYYSGMPMRKNFGKWEVLSRGSWTTYTDKESAIEWRKA